MDAGPPHYRRVRRGEDQKLKPSSSLQLSCRRWGREILHTCKSRRMKEEEGKEEKSSSSRRGRGRRRKRKGGRKKGNSRGRRKRRAVHALESKLGMEEAIG